jgi:hypothetical protein
MKLILLLVALSCFLQMGCASNLDWRTASRESAGIAPSPQEEKEALVHVYTARAFGWRKYFAVHSWIATKEKNADHYITYHVTSWATRNGGSSVAMTKDIPDRRWYGAEPELIAQVKGPAAESAIQKIQEAVRHYPYPQFYRVMPGPNSNTFISYLLRHTPEIGVELPPNAIGKDWINQGDFFSLSETHTGVQVSAWGLLGFTIGLGDGIEVNIASMTFGIDFWRPALKLPFIGRLGFKDAPVFQAQ